MALHEILQDHKTPTPANIVLDKDEVSTIHLLLNKIDQRESEILRLHFGLEDGRSWTLKEIGEKVGLTRERVRQIKQGALRRLNGHLSSDRLPTFEITAPIRNASSPKMSQANRPRNRPRLVL